MSQVLTCRAADLFDNEAFPALCAAYETECANPLLGPTRPERRRYEAMELVGMLQCFAIREDLRLIGFASLLVAVVPHFELTHATVESIFIAKESRCIAAWFALRGAIEDFARKAGAGAIFYTAPVNSSLARILEHESDAYLNTNLVFARRLN